MMFPEREYIVYFEAFGRKYQMKTIANSEQEAKDNVLKKIKFHKVIKPDNDFNSTISFFDETLK